MPTSDYQRAYNREYSRRRYRGQSTAGIADILRAQGIERPDRSRPCRATYSRRVLIEQAIARGDRTSKIMRDLACTYDTVRAVRDQLDDALVA